MIVEFKNQEGEYMEWQRVNPHGYVYNDFGGLNPQYNKLHEANCWRLNNLGGGSKRTSYRKVCSSNLSELQRWIEDNRGPEGKAYSRCICSPC